MLTSIMWLFSLQAVFQQVAGVGRGESERLVLPATILFEQSNLNKGLSVHR